MPEGADRDGELRAAAPLRLGAVTLLPIARVVVRAHRGAAGIWVSALQEPCALIVRDAGGVRVVDVGAGAPSLEQLRERIPGLDALLATP